MSLKGTNVIIVKIIIITVAIIIIMKMDFNVGLATLKEKRGGIQNRFVNCLKSWSFKSVTRDGFFLQNAQL